MTDHRGRILVIDDSPEYLGFMETLLTSEGYLTEVAGTLDGARERLLLARPDLIISDVRMPGLPAFAVLDLIDANDKLRSIPVLLCTGAVQEIDEAANRLRRTAVTVLYKPFDIDDLLARITELLKREP
ncbi:MAG: response regulator [Chloroflexi bacterium]|nr:response regulator [Chloroflexota bacterium]